MYFTYLILDNRYRSFKNARRRVVETVMEGVGKSERTVDEEYELFKTNYEDMIDDMEKCEYLTTLDIYTAP